MKNQSEGMRMKRRVTISIVIALLLGGGVLTLLPTEAWAPTDVCPFNGELVLISLGDGVTGSPWSSLRTKLTNSLNNSSDDEDSKGIDGDKRF